MADSVVAPANVAVSEKKSSKKTTTIAPDHPTYNTMILEAIHALKERNGSSRIAIKKYLHDTYGITEKNKTHVNMALKRSIENGVLKQVGGSFKVNREHKEPVKSAPTKVNSGKAAKKSEKGAAKSPAKKSAGPKSDSATKKATKKTTSEPKKTIPKKGSTATSTKKAATLPPKSASAKSPKPKDVLNKKPKVTKKTAAAH